MASARISYPSEVNRSIAAIDDTMKMEVMELGFS